MTSLLDYLGIEELALATVAMSSKATASQLEVAPYDHHAG